MSPGASKDTVGTSDRRGDIFVQNCMGLNLVPDKDIEHTGGRLRAANTNKRELDKNWKDSQGRRARKRPLHFREEFAQEFLLRLAIDSAGFRNVLGFLLDASGRFIQFAGKSR